MISHITWHWQVRDIDMNSQRYSIACPHGQAMPCLLRVFGGKNFHFIKRVWLFSSIADADESPLFVLSTNWMDAYRADSRFAPSQWERPLLCNDVPLAGCKPRIHPGCLLHSSCYRGPITTAGTHGLWLVYVWVLCKLEVQLKTADGKEACIVLKIFSKWRGTESFWYIFYVRYRTTLSSMASRLTHQMSRANNTNKQTTFAISNRIARLS